LVVAIVVLRQPGPRRPTLIVTRQILLRTVRPLASWAVGLLVAAWIVPGVSVSVPGHVAAVVVFAAMQAILSVSTLELPHRYALPLIGGTGWPLTIVALILASVSTQGLSFDGMASWLAMSIVVWLLTSIGAITLSELLIRAGARAGAVIGFLARSTDDGGRGGGRHV
jgi:hypothetical protein